jgi:hypothetical protein
MKKPKIKVNNHMKAYGTEDDRTGVIEINKKKHKGDKSELKDTIAHELYHFKHPKATEKKTYKSTTSEIKSKEVSKLLKLLKNK